LSLHGKYISDRLAERKSLGLYRTLKPESSLIDFSSNDYLGFARSPELKAKIDKEVNSLPHYLNGSTGSRLLSGNLTYTEELERQIANFHNAKAGLIFNSGYDANVGLFSSLPQKGDTIICDELIHASIIDGARLSYANRFSFKHNDPESLEAKLKQAAGNCYVVIESVYSMDGDTPPLQEILNLTNQYNASLIVDEAHSVGLYKKGLVCELGLEYKIFARIITFGKALGCHGAIVLGSDDLRKYLINFARSFIYTTAASVHQIASIKMAYEMLDEADELITGLKNHIDFFNLNVRPPVQPIIPSTSAIHCLPVYGNHNARTVAAQVQNAGLDVRAILSPTVAVGNERLRICLHAFNTTEEMELLIHALNNMEYAC
jgi:8-amino-7-oxononanoate synthase